MKIIRPEVQQTIVNQGGITDLMDNMVKLFYNITDEELDQICENASDEELKIFIDATGKEEQPATFGELRQGFIVRNKYVKFYKK